MNTSLQSIKLEKSQVTHDQVYEKVRDLLQTGRLQSGEKMPGTQKLAKMLDTHSATVHIALQKLAREGWLNRIPKKGTYVMKREEKLTRVGVYCTADVKGSPYAHAVREALSRELHETGIEMDLWMDPRPRDQFGEPWAPLVKAAGNRRFQAFIATEVNMPLLQWQKKLPVPTAILGAPPSVPNSVDNDLAQFVEIGLQELARQGCRSVGFIAPLLDAPDDGNPEGYYRVVSFGVLSHFMKVAGDLGLTVKNDWMRVLLHHFEGARGQEHFGYEQFLELWSQPEKPEGLLVFADVTARGVLMAVQEKQVRVPGELKLALAKNESIDLFCPVSATFVVASEREMARALIGQIQKQFRGESCERIALPFKIMAHNNP